MAFGRKRVQYENFMWFYFHFDNFDTYFNRNGKNLALYTASYVQTHLQEIESQLGSPLADHLQFIIFNRLTDYKQSNIGYLDEENYNSGGITKLQGNKVFLFFKGDYVDLERQIREGIVEVLVNQLFYGSSISAQVKSNTVIELPAWFRYGLVSYLSTPWDKQRDNSMREAMQTKKYQYIAALEDEDAKEAGHSLFRYIATRYGDDAVLRILRVVTSQRKIDRVIQYTLNIKYKDLIKSWQAFYKDETRMEAVDNPTIDKALKKVKQRDRKHSNFVLSPDNTMVAYISNEKGRARVHVRNLKTGKHKVIMKIGYALNDHPDYTYPALAWHPAGEILAIAAENHGQTGLCTYNIKDGKKIWHNIEQFDKVMSITYSPNGRMLAMSAVQQGQSDIYTFNMVTRVATQVTKDIYDDAKPQFLLDNNTLIFSSNRPVDSIFNKPQRFSQAPSLNPNHAIFLYQPSQSTDHLLQITEDSLTHFSNPLPYSDGQFTFLTDQSGITNRAIGMIDSTIASVDTAIHYRYITNHKTVTNFSRSILEQNKNSLSTYLSDIFEYNKKQHLIMSEVMPMEEIEALTPSLTRYAMQLQEIQHAAEERLQQTLNDTISEDSNNRAPIYRIRQSTWNDVIEQKIQESIENVLNASQSLPFNATVDDTVSTTDTLALRKSVRERLMQVFGLTNNNDSIQKTINPKQHLYHVEYVINDLTTQVNFNFLSTSYQAFSGGTSPIYLNSGTAGFLKIGASDLMENHRLIGGYRFSFDFSQTEYMLSYENLENRIGKQSVFHRQSITETDPMSGYTFKQLTHNIYHIRKFPFNEVLLLKGTIFGRMDRLMVKAVDDNSLSANDVTNYWGGLKMELIYDHTRTIAKNIKVGARSKVFGEYYQSLTEKNTSMFVVGADYRHYLRLWRTFIWANRVAGSSSFGQSKLIYYMGGVDDWLTPRFNRDIAVDKTQNYAYQTLATNMRGFTQNIRNGNNFVVFNSELRFPILACLLSQPINKAWLQNLQLVGFVDAGSAWVGINPWNKDNAIYNKNYDYGDLQITINKELSPFVLGLGYGLRTELFGYFIRVDRGYGIENGYMNKPVWSVSFGFDF
ncbi:hypothetical protein FACS1894201_00880 [Bacteroidia bacterium]|nr:hypothetical protein FACS1894201_00880 [Bacteroidia bacterium]